MQLITPPSKPYDSHRMFYLMCSRMLAMKSSGCTPLVTHLFSWFTMELPSVFHPYFLHSPLLFTYGTPTTWRVVIEASGAFQ